MRRRSRRPWGEATVISDEQLWKIETGDVQEILQTFPDQSIHCVVTSPPYWRLRDYCVAGQIGLEDNFDEYIEKLVSVFREVRRVLRNDGTLWLNLGDKYAQHGYSGGGDPTIGKRNLGSQMNIRSIKRFVPKNCKPKDLIGIPWRVAFALQADGWYLRSDIIWHKSNPMPESVRDRPTSSHEHIFLFTKSPKYFYDNEAVKEPALEANWESRYDRVKPGHKSIPDALRNGTRLRKQDSVGKRTYTGFNDRYRQTPKRNIRNVWRFSTSPFPKAHFATFPPALPERCIRAGTSQYGVCPRCGAPWRRTTTKINTGIIQKIPDGWDTERGSHDTIHRNGRSKGETGIPVMQSVTTGWQPDCDCSCPEAVPATVLDPFAGAGTTLLVALHLGRRAIGIEINSQYVRMAEERIFNDAPLFYCF